MADLAYRQARGLEAASDALDQKAGVLLGFLAVVLTLGLQMLFASGKEPVELLFGYVATAALLVSIALLILAVSPKPRRTVPDVAALIEKHWESTAVLINREVALNLKEAWVVNSRIHERKAVLLIWALWIALAAISVMVFVLAVLPALM